MQEKYLKATPTFDSDSEPIKQKAKQLTEGKSDDIERAKALFYFVRDKISYNIYVQRHMPEHFKASNTLARGTGYCVQKAVLLITLARAVGIPARLCCAKIRNRLVPPKVLEMRKSDIFLWHGFAELYLDGKWVKATPAFDAKMCQGRFMPVEFDGRHDAILHPYSLDGKPHIEYLLYRGVFDDVPLEEIRKEQIEREQLDPKEIFGK